jgi:hypothetical protein
MVRLSKHAADEMEGRNILRRYIEAALADPDLTMADKNDTTLTRSYKMIPEFGGRVLRVVHRPDGADIFVVTAHWDRGVRL